MRNLSLIVLIGCAVFTLSVIDRGVTVEAQNKAAPKLSEVERALIAGSRNAIVRTGMSEKYFDKHFKLVKVVNQPGDRRVVWNFKLDDYSTDITDVLGYYTRDGKRIDTHSVAASLRKTSDIKRTISRRKADQIMQQCIGSFRNPTVEFRADHNGARLFLTAESIPKGRGDAEERREREEREERERQAKPKPTPGADVIEEEDDYGPPITVGSVDLQSGKCTKGKLEVARAIRRGDR